MPATDSQEALLPRPTAHAPGGAAERHWLTYRLTGGLQVWTLDVALLRMCLSEATFLHLCKQKWECSYSSFNCNTCVLTDWWSLSLFEPFYQSRRIRYPSINCEQSDKKRKRKDLLSLISLVQLLVVNLLCLPTPEGTRHSFKNSRRARVVVVTFEFAMLGHF